MKSIRRTTQALILMVFVSGLLLVAFTNCSKGGFNATAPDRSQEDTFLWTAWYIQNSGQKVFARQGGAPGNDLNLSKTWGSGLNGEGVKILISDDGLEDTHEDLKENYYYENVSKDYTQPSPYTGRIAPPSSASDNHGTSVAGLAAAQANKLGIRGVAHKAWLVSANFISSAVKPTNGTLVDQARGPFDIFNMSWGAKQSTLAPTVAEFQAVLKSGATEGRGGKGSIYVKSSGNNFSIECRNNESEICVGNAAFDQDNSSPYLILVSALNANGLASSYSSPGANLWISSFGGEYGDDSPAMVTTDRMTCDVGYAVTNMSGLVFERGGQGNSGCNYTATFNGTSAAAPILSGAVALLLQANPNLTWRDVIYILAKTAYPVNYTTSGSISHPKNEPIPSGAVWEQVWIENKGGFKFHNWYGFGRIDIDKAVALAKNYTSSFTPLQETNWVDDSSGLSKDITDNSALAITDTINVETNLKIEAVQIRVWIEHTNISDLALELVGPSTTKSIVVNMNNALRGIADYNGEVFLTNAFYGERSLGNWTLRVIDGKATHTGKLNRWSINFLGAETF